MSRKKLEGRRSCGFKAPAQAYEVLTRVAHLRGIDVSAVLNQLLREKIPSFLEELRHAERSEEWMTALGIKQPSSPASSS